MGNCQKQEDVEYKSNPDNDEQGPVSKILVVNSIWNQDYQGLFDYDTKQIERKVLKIQGNAILVKNSNRYQLVDDNIKNLTQQQLKDSQFRLLQRDQFYKIIPILLVNQTLNYIMPRIMWLIVASLPQKIYKIKQKDILKLGKQRIKVRQIAFQDSNPSNFLQNYKLTKTVYQNLAYQGNKDKQVPQTKQQNGQMSDITNNEQVCRICLDPGQYTNPLITPCKCSGSVKYIHYNCLRSWLAKRLSIQKTQYCYTINWCPLSCQMCKSSFSYRIYMDNKKFYTVQIPKPPRPYIILELVKKNSKQSGKIFHFVSFASKKKIVLGRRKDIDVRLADDISISRAHANIQYNSQKKQFYISDNKSKFGTLILVKKGIIIRPQCKDISLQIGAEVYTFNSFRGPTKPNFKKQQIYNNEYMAQNLSDQQDQQEIQQNQDDQLNSSQPQNQRPINNDIRHISQHRSSVQTNNL